MAITELNILQANDYGQLNRMMKDALADNWQPMGYLRIAGESQKDFFQMMYKGTNVDVNAYQSIIANGQQLTVKNSSGSMQVTGTAAISQSSVTGISLPATTAMVNNTQAISIPVTAGVLVAIGTATRTVTLTVSGGAITAAAIS